MAACRCLVVQYDVSHQNQNVYCTLRKRNFKYVLKFFYFGPLLKPILSNFKSSRDTFQFLCLVCLIKKFPSRSFDCIYGQTKQILSIIQAFVLSERSTLLRQDVASGGNVILPIIRSSFLHASERKVITK